MAILVRNVMKTEVLSLDAATPLLEAVRIMADRKVRSAVTPPRHEHDAFGMISFRDIAEKVLHGDERLEMLNVYDLMIKPCVSVPSHWGIRYAARFMHNMDVRRAIVTDDGKNLLGVLSVTDMVMSLLNDKSS